MQFRLAYLPFIILALAALADPMPAQDQDKEAAQFKFQDVDQKVYNDSNAIDDLYAKKGLILHDADLQAHIDSIGANILGSRPIPERVQFRFRVLRDPMVQAFALPNGSVYITTGLLALLENDAQLAGVLGHETAHVFERHTYFENRSIRKKALTMNVLAIVGSAAPIGGNLPAAVNIFGAAVQAGILAGDMVIISSVFGYSREKEHEADSDGLLAMTAAGYDPSAMTRAFELLDDDSKLEYEPIQTFYHDHPKLADRKTFAAGYAATHKPAQPVTVSESDYLAKVATAIVADIELDLNSRRQRTAVARAARLADAFPDNSKYRVLLADSYRSLGAKTKTPTQDELTDHGQAEHRKEYFKMTEAEEEARLLKKPGGDAALHENQAKAEALYAAVLQADQGYAPAHRGFGFLYEDEGKYAQAATEYQAYLGMVAGTSLDHLRIERRLAAVQKLAASTPATPALPR
jgi:predicted Zn-dependent protease